MERVTGPLLEKPVLWQSLSTIDPVSAATRARHHRRHRRPSEGGPVLVRDADRHRRRLASALLGLRMATIGTEFGDIASNLPLPEMPKAV
jgi:hypothetical protein